MVVVGDTELELVQPSSVYDLAQRAYLVDFIYMHSQVFW
jgi:hypothetical protein